MLEILTFLTSSPMLIALLCIIILIIVFIYLKAFLEGREITFWPPKIGGKHPKNVNSVEASISSQDNNNLVLKGYPRSQHPRFFAEVERLVQKAKTITLIATGLNLIWEKHILDLLIERAKSGETTVTICLGNPYNPHVEDRLIEEEMKDNRPPVGKDGIIKNVKALVERLEAAGNPKNFSLLLFEHYPTFATLIFDKDIFIYPYGYIVLGNISPIIHFTDDNSEEVSFFKTNAERIILDSVPAKEVVARYKNPKYFSDNWINAAIYLIPNSDDPFYHFGSSVLGYDIFNQKPVRQDESSPFSKLGSYVGEAANYGFHATLADALFFIKEAEIERIQAELRMLSNEFPPLKLTNMCIVERDEPQDIVVLCDDKMGIAEALHNELISRVYRLAISSNYLAGKTSKHLPKNTDRARFMINKYGSPYIIREFQLHFTLCSRRPINTDDSASVLDLLKANYKEICKTDHVEIDELYLLIKKPNSEKWQIHSKYPLCGKVSII